MHYAFQDRENLFILMDYLGGGDLRFHISMQKIFTENQASNNNLIISIFIFY
jgi:serine/threonine protein kinase